MRGGVGGAAVWLAATALVAGLASVTTAPVSGASTAAPARPGGCADVRVVWAGGHARDAAVRELRRVPGQRVSVTAVAPPSRELTTDDLGDIRSQGLRHRHFADWRARARRTVRAVVRSARACPPAHVVQGGPTPGAVLVDGVTAAHWTLEQDRERAWVTVHLHQPVPTAGIDAITEEAGRLLTFAAPQLVHQVRVLPA